MFIDSFTKRSETMQKLSTKQTVEISSSEWEVMRVVWATKQTSSREIVQVLEEKMNWKPPTTKTLIGRLVKKGILDTNQQGNKYIYTPLIKEEECVQKESENCSLIFVLKKSERQLHP
jgi:predicted transcriptional regulator